MKYNEKLFVFTLTLGLLMSLTLTMVKAKPVSAHTEWQTISDPITRTWRLLTPTLQPATLGEHAMAYDYRNGTVILYGGNATGQPYEATTWAFRNNQWQPITTTHQPQARYGMGMAQANIQVVLFGGSDAWDTPLSQTWVYVNNDWLELTPTVSPPARVYPSMVGLEYEIHLFGGQQGPTYFQDLWQYLNGQWRMITPTNNLHPPARALAALTYDSGQQRLLLFGGQNEAGVALDDLWAFNLSSKTWQELTPTVRPSARWGHTLTFDPQTQLSWLIGGTINDETLLGEIWVYDTTWHQLPQMDLALAYQQTVYQAISLLTIGQGQTWVHELMPTISPTNLLLNGNFESGDWTGWQPVNMSLEATASYSGVYGARMSQQGGLTTTFPTVIGQSYEVVAQLRIDEVISAATTLGLVVQVRNAATQKQLGRSSYYLPNNGTLTLSQWQRLRFTFVAQSSSSQLMLANMSDGLFIASFDEASVKVITQLRSYKLTPRRLYLPIILQIEPKE